MNKHEKNGKSPQGGAAVIDETKNLANSQSEVNGNGKLHDTEKGAHAAIQTLSTVEDTIRKVETLNQLIEKRNILLTHQGKVNALKFGDFEDKDFLTLNSGTGGYPIKSPALCKKIAVLVKEEIASHIKEVEAQIHFNL